MADATTPPAKTAPPPVVVTEPLRELSEASASTDPAVHQLIARRYIASMNDEHDVIDDVSAQLAELGYK